LVTDAQIAAVAQRVQGTVYSADADFGRFEGLRWKNPLVGKA
jgi:predicted nucleic acid-binding protein